MKAGTHVATFTVDKVTAVDPIGEGQCIALGYESVLPLVLLTLQGGDMKPYIFSVGSTDEHITETGLSSLSSKSSEKRASSVLKYVVLESFGDIVHTGIL
ncbi:hypothetical protein AWC38_SpisGene4740 [Stylophora pistillata]|uniref:Uncharacterized protein n=1 Tax=Stylophora pistillata TaxID=50429 RepID=A0A2B4SNL2_STYPI|nr:hypothetical protein AWC38_SpisGene4740 [Stylophora pistillata]